MTSCCLFVLLPLNLISLINTSTCKHSANFNFIVSQFCATGGPDTEIIKESDRPAGAQKLGVISMREVVPGIRLDANLADKAYPCNLLRKMIYDEDEDLVNL